MENKKGCVYFFRHIGLTPVKIGYSNSESPIDRFTQFKTYAPYGSEIIGFIQSYEAKQLETTLHERFSAFRLSGEWFEITQEQCESVISFYSNIEDVKERNEFQQQFALYINNRKEFKKMIIKESEVKKDRFFYYENYYSNDKMSINEKANLMGVSRKTISIWNKSR